jgi:neopullulanase
MGMAKIKQAFRFCVLAVWIMFGHAVAAPVITKVEPPNWWVPRMWNPLQILLTGRDFKGATVTAASEGVKTETRYVSANGHYLFLYLNISQDLRPGTYRFRVQNDSGSSDFDFRLDPPADRKGRFQGFGPDDVIYLLMPDRFARGRAASNAPPPGETGSQNYHGGNIRGIINHLDYLKDLGVTGLWLTPIYQNSSANIRGAYHGYSAIDFYAVEPHFGTMADFIDLTDAAHKMGLKVVQDQVANHCGPNHPWVTDPPTKTWFNYLNRKPKPRNNFDIASLADPYARPSRRDVPLRAWFDGLLPDLNQDDPLLADYEIQNALWWIGMTGIDGIRQDTYPYVPRSFWEKWQTAINAEYPDFVCVAEIGTDSPAVLSFFDGGVRRYGIDTKLRSALDFPLERALRDVFAHDQNMTDLVNILAQDSLYQRPDMLVAFSGNHDQPRMMTETGDDAAKVMMAETFLLTTRRAAHLYYGDEIGMVGGRDPDNRRNFPGGFPGDQTSAFTPEGRPGDAATVFNWTRALLRFRLRHPALRRGDLVNLLTARDRYAYLRSSPEEYVLVLLNRGSNTNDADLAVDDLAMPEGLRFKSFPEGATDLAVAAGKLVLREPNEIEIYWAKRPRPAAAKP